ncbi:hypothetical protein B0H15DRAFT_839421 [Mycena belliarum]|uniref:Uncharacterized protein n=1 Tax=Mycena belliarum TaxID=1033014 RepID=A0AAD6XV54_9AGAR|nr:hypothetical protein B0H15DRAFT_839421 [Mycena belliae]
MDANDSRNSSRRASVRGRPQIAPMGPRTRQFSRNSLMPSGMGVASQSPRDSTLSSEGASPRYSAPSAAEPSDTKTLAAAPLIPPPPPQQMPPDVLDEPLNVTAVPKIAGLTPPPKMNFESVPVKWKGLPLEAALWTFNSQELQNLVSRAIRSSSRESFIRVLSIENLDKTLPAELERLEALRAMTQSKYRFTVHRRTMLLQALHSFSGYNDRAQDAELVAKLTSQLSQTTAECDQFLGDLLQIADQVGQITRLLDVHWASALAIALRKLNSSYGRRTTDLLAAREKIATLKAELDDAWQQAEKLAKEMDELDAAVGSDEEESDAVIEVAEVVSLNHRKSPSGSSMGLRSVLSIDAISRMCSEQSQTTSVQASTTNDGHDTQPSISPSQTRLPSPTMSELGFLSEAPMSPLVAIPTAETSMAEKPDSASIRSGRSAKSARSGRSVRSTKSTRANRPTDTRVNSVSAARRRSLRTSLGSLRMPSIKGRKASHPPVPSLPPHSAAPSPVSVPSRSSMAQSFLDFGSRDASDSDTEDIDVAVPRRTSIDEIEIVARTPVWTPTAASFQTRDDLHVMPSRSATENELVAPRRSQFSLDHQHPFANEAEPVNQSIPSIWLLQDAPKTPAERVESMMRDHGPGHAKMGSFQRLKSLTKRYSLPFPGAARPKPTRNAGS